MQTPIPTAPVLVSAETFWQHADRIGSYIFAAVILVISLGSTMSAILYKIFS